MHNVVTNCVVDLQLDVFANWTFIMLCNMYIKVRKLAMICKYRLLNVCIYQMLLSDLKITFLCFTVTEA